MLSLRCRVTILDAERFPPLVEASFTDARGLEVRIHDKEPIFRSHDDPEGEGTVRCRLVAGALPGERDAICVVDIDRPDHLEAVDGSTRFEVRASQLAPDDAAAGLAPP